MKFQKIIYGIKSSQRTYFVMRLLKRFSGYVYVPVDRIRGSDVTIPKYVVPNWVKSDEVFVIFSALSSGKQNNYFYHPKARKWYKDVKEEDFPRVFPWL